MKTNRTWQISSNKHRKHASTLRTGQCESARLEATGLTMSGLVLCFWWCCLPSCTRTFKFLVEGKKTSTTTTNAFFFLHKKQIIITELECKRSVLPNLVMNLREGISELLQLSHIIINAASARLLWPSCAICTNVATSSFWVSIPSGVKHTKTFYISPNSKF